MTNVSQHRTTFYLLLNNATGAAAGLLFWLLLARILQLPAEEIGWGYAVIALGTMVSLVAKGGLDTALLRSVPATSDKEGTRLLAFGIGIGAVTAIAVSAILAGVTLPAALVPELADWSWVLIAGIAILMVVTALQDAWFLAEGNAKATWQRNLVFAGGRLILPVPVVLFAVPGTVPVVWLLALLFATLAGIVLARHRPRHEGKPVARKDFLRCAARNVTGNAAQFLPGLLLVPLVLAVNGPAAAGYFGIAWAAASLLFLGAAAIGRSALAEMVRNHPRSWGNVIRRGSQQAAVLLIPATVAGVVLSRQVLWIFGASYAAAASTAFAILCASTVFVAPTYLYLALLRARERTWPLLLFPAAMIVALFAAAPTLSASLGLTGVALAWFSIHVPLGLFAAWRLYAEVTHATLDRAVDLG